MKLIIIGFDSFQTDQRLKHIVNPKYQLANPNISNLKILIPMLNIINNFNFFL